MMTIPPPPLTRAEFHRRWDGGARSMAEIDPAFARWKKENERMRAAQIAGLVIGGAILLLTVLVVAVAT